MAKKASWLKAYDTLTARRIRAFRRALVRIIRYELEQRAFQTVTEWAAENRHLPITASEPGRYNPARLAYQVGIQDAFTVPGVKELTVQAAERTGKSTIAVNILGYVIDRRPAAVIWSLPSKQLMEDFVRDEVKPMLAASPRLQRKLRTPKKRKNGDTIRRIEFEGGTATFVGSGASANIGVKTAKYVINDETDKMRNLPNEGDADTLLAKRITTFEQTGGMILRFSKPTTPDRSRIYRHYLRGSQNRYFLPCPGCGELQHLRWAHIRPEDARAVCEKCKEYFTQDQWLAASGTWIETRHCVEHKSFQLSILFSPYVRWETLIEEYRLAQEAAEMGDLSLMVVFENSRLGEPSGVLGAYRVEAQTLYDRRHFFGEAEVVDGVIGLTLGVDTQDDGFKWLLAGWGRLNEVWLLATGTIAGDMDSPGPWQELQQLLSRFWYDEQGNLYRCLCACLDCQGHHYEKVLQFVRANAWRRVTAVRGLGSDKRKSNASGPVAIIRNEYKDKATGTPVRNIDSDGAKSLISVLLQREERVGPGVVHLPAGKAGEDVRGFDLGAISELTSEYRRKKMVAGYPIYTWHKIADVPNHRLDCFAYALCAKLLVRIDWEKNEPLRIKTDKVPEFKEQQGDKFKPTEQPTSLPRRPPRQRPRSNWWRRGF